MAKLLPAILVVMYPWALANTWNELGYLLLLLLVLAGLLWWMLLK